MTDLNSVPSIAASIKSIEDAAASLGSALVQVIPSDDKIIVEHMRTAYETLLKTLPNLRAHQ